MPIPVAAAMLTSAGIAVADFGRRQIPLWLTGAWLFTLQFVHGYGLPIVAVGVALAFAIGYAVDSRFRENVPLPDGVAVVVLAYLLPIVLFPIVTLLVYGAGRLVDRTRPPFAAVAGVPAICALALSLGVRP